MAAVLQPIHEELEQLIQRLKQKLAVPVWEELEAFVDQTTENRFDTIYSSLDERYLLLKKDIYDRLSDEASRERIDPKELQRRFFEIANPKDMYQDLWQAFQFHEIGTEYEHYLSMMQNEIYGELFKPLALPPSFYEQLSLRVMNESSPAFTALASYGDQVKEHIELLKIEQSAKGFRFITKIVAKGIGLVTLGPFGSIGAGILMNMLFDGNSKVGQSWANTEEELFSFLDVLNESLEKMKQAYKYVLLALYGGAFVKVNEVLGKNHLELYSLNLAAYEYTLSYTGREKVNFSLWVERQVFMIKRKISEGKWNEAHVMTDRFYHYVNSQPGAFPIVLKNGRSVLRESFLLKYIVISKLAEEKKRKQADWISFVQEIFKQLPHMVRKEEAAEYSVKSPAEWGMLLVHQANKMKDPTVFEPYLDYTYRLVKRKKNDWKIPQGEELVEGELDWCVLFGFITSDFLLEKWKRTHPLQADGESIYYEKNWLKFLRKWYIEVTGSKDRMTRYLSLFIQAINLSYVITPSYKLIKKAGKEIHRNWKPILKTSVSAAIILLLVYGAFHQKDRAIAFFAGWNEKQESTGVTAVNGEESYQTLTIQVDGGANVRSEASIDGAILFTLRQGTEVLWFGEEAYEASSGNWYYIESENGEGWMNEMVLHPSNEPDLTSNDRETTQTDLSDTVNVTETIQSAPDISMETEIEEDVSEQMSSFYRLKSVDFGHAERSYQANLDERTDTSVQYPYLLSITETVSATTYVQSSETLYRKPKDLWATNIKDESYQIVAVSYADASNEINFFLVDPNGDIETSGSLTVSEFHQNDDGFIYSDAATGEERLLSIESGQSIDRPLSYEANMDSGALKDRAIEYLNTNVENLGAGGWTLYDRPEQSSTEVSAYLVYKTENDYSPFGEIYIFHDSKEISWIPW